MEKHFRIKTLNRIAPEGLALFDERYLVDPAEKNPHGIIVRSAPVVTGDKPALLAVARAGAGVNNITVDQATALGICIFNTPGANANAVAELVFALLGTWARNIHAGIDFCRGLRNLSGDGAVNREVEAKKASFRGFELAGKTLGVLGLGNIGVLVANGGVRRRMSVIGFDPFPAFENMHMLSARAALAPFLGEVVRNADILSVHIPLNNKTRGFINEDFIRRMRRGAILINFARGPIVEDEAVLGALAEGRLGGYLTDFPTKALLGHPQVVAIPHLGASTEESEEKAARMAVKELRAYLEYGTIIHSVNFPTVESVPARNVAMRFIMINRDIPDMIGFASHAIGAKGINIVSYLNESNGSIGYNIIDVEAPLPAEVIARIEANSGVIRTRAILPPFEAADW